MVSRPGLLAALTYAGLLGLGAAGAQRFRVKADLGATDRLECKSPDRTVVLEEGRPADCTGTK